MQEIVSMTLVDPKSTMYYPTALKYVLIEGGVPVDSSSVGRNLQTTSFLMAPDFPFFIKVFS